MSISYRNRGFVFAVGKASDGLIFASVYFKESPTMQLFLEVEQGYDNILKVFEHFNQFHSPQFQPGNVIEFYRPGELDINQTVSPRPLHVELFDSHRNTEVPDKPNELCQVLFITNAIFTTDNADDPALEQPDVYAVGYSEDFGRFVVTNTFNNLDDVQFEKGKLYRVAIGR